MSKNPETLLTQKITHALRQAGAWVLKVHGSAWTPAGTPDLLVCYRGQFVALEVKTMTGRTTQLQDFALHQIAQAGGRATVVRSVGEALEALKGL